MAFPSEVFVSYGFWEFFVGSRALVLERFLVEWSGT